MAKIKKAIAAAILAAAAALTPSVLADGVSTTEWVVVGVAAVVAGLTVYQVRNEQ